MKKINKSIYGVLLAGLTLSAMTSCIDEAEPRNGTVTQDMLGRSSTATASIVNGLPAYGKTVWSRDYHFSYGTSAIMRIRDVMTDDYAVVDHDYNQFSAWAATKALGPSYLIGQYVYTFYYSYVFASNLVIAAVNPEKASNEQLGYLGLGYAYRAANYLDLARMYEFLPTDVNPTCTNEQGYNVKNLTVPIVTDTLSEKASRNNPRATHEEMFKFIESDLNNAEKYIVHLASNSNNTLPDLAVVYGLKARLYMWNEDYAQAKEYARKAIDTYGKAPISEADATDVKKGFNDISKWMWGAQYTSEDRAVRTGIINFTSFASNETVFGYAGNGPMNMIGKSFYDRISDTDWRKTMWKAPDGSPLEAKNKYINGSKHGVDFKKRIPTYGSLKFRPNEGNYYESPIATASAYPLMRVEEMYFIEAEAAERVAAGTGIALLENFMKTRDKNYTYTGTDAIDEIIFQKRIELWGEGQSFFDIKRANLSVTRGYQDTNFFEDWRFNTNGRPAWMNFCIVALEENDNPAVKGKNNPDPSRAYPLWKE
ncbi:RagB/SusD family nutrient uptake outer membrane protein [Prevotella intermedia]|uniref:RagB/SusD family nutrient uptake outer membrane protein n=1 Tax=Prevotella intermedia TaxID=28131 RepID=A0A2A6ECQ6_PREIN|nr:RagB/SusD family nutrient uptake outer membrane protein [Prevotella intermedia]PDP59285.1 RagB/SusD family nutrient uptake outer membrane protein [Prevotella intermedia]